MDNNDINQPVKITIKHIAKAAGVSISTVSRALSHHPTASKKTTKRINALAEKLNYFPDSLAKSLRKKKTGMIGVILNDLTNPFYAEMLSQIGAVIGSTNYSMFVCYSNWDIGLEKKNILSLLSRRVDGVILSPVHEKSPNISLLTQNGVETVIIDCYPAYDNLSYVYTEHGKGSVIATDYLLKNGHKNILIMTGPIHSSLEDNYVNGYINTLKKHNIDTKDEYFVRCDELSIACGYETFKELINNNPRSTILDCTAIITICDNLAIGIYKVANDLGFSIPGNYSLVGYDNNEVSGALIPPLTTIHQPRKEIGSESIKLLIRNIENEDAREREIITFTPHLVIRGSVRRL